MTYRAIRICSLFLVSSLLLAPFSTGVSGTLASGDNEHPFSTPASAPPTAYGQPAARPAPSPYSRRPSKDALKWADDELKKMTLDEKIGQLISIGINATFLNRESAAYRAIR